ncbi:uncharacterized protein DSM5745_05028 [Aspergillus mulundensis]|uniref:HNH nuclease domain-containing protein n=1 Tax=Aspergillus mulundensis TaxID=1810919 RepID=A0A3D8S5X9_9EURO|nr:hypothetical protein DSM5745_05028 [Aspergillus mulundensis]RDW81471.1 hypothetical protein DSM5745_05028 [Aspergillus mulundensis]
MAAFVAPETYRPRNTHIFSGKGDYLGGAYINSPAQIRKDDFHSMCDSFLMFPGKPHVRWSLHHLKDDNEVGDLVSRTSDDITPDRYIILGPQSDVVDVQLSTQPAIRRAPSAQVVEVDDTGKSMRTNQAHFRNGVLNRDNETCTITGWKGETTNQATHIFPVSKVKLWDDEGYARWITDTNSPRTIGPSKLFSMQNGLLLCLNVHILFDLFVLAINPDRGYRIVYFEQDENGIGGGTLNPSTRDCSDPNNRVSDECLRWHFHQAVLTNMRGVGERPWDLNPDEEGDLGLMMEKENASEILEEVFADRLGAFIQADEDEGEDHNHDHDHDADDNADYDGYHDDDDDAQ